MIARGLLLVGAMLLMHWALGSVRALRGAGWRSTVRWLLSILAASALTGWHLQ